MKSAIVVAIMNSHVSNVDDAQPDDEQGAQALYGVGAAGIAPVEGAASPAATVAKFTSPQAARVNTSAFGCVAFAERRILLKSKPFIS